MVRLSPRQVASSDSTNVRSPPAPTSARPYDQPVSPSSAYAAVCSTGDSEWAIGDPRTAQRWSDRAGRLSCHSGRGGSGTTALELQTICWNSASVSANFVSPVSKSTVVK